MIMVRKFLLVVLMFYVGMVSSRSSEPEFKLFCRILEEADRLIMDTNDYVYDEHVDREIVKEMEVFYNATTDNMDEFRKTLWMTKDFFVEHPPPRDPKNRRDAHREIGQLIKEAERKIQENRELAKKINQEKDDARLSVLQGLYGEQVKKLNLNDVDIMDMRSNTNSIFVDDKSAAQSCGNEKETGKTLFNDFFCVCVGDGDVGGAHSPCSGSLISPTNGNNDCCKKNKCCGGNCCHTNNCCDKDCCKCCGKWTQMKYESSSKDPLSLADSIEKIMGECSKTKEKYLKKGMSDLLEEYVGMIGKGAERVKKHGKKIFGHSGRSKDNVNVNITTCDGTKGSHTNASVEDEKNNENICVDYTKTLELHKDIPWHNKFKNYTHLMKEAKTLEDQILKNRAALILLKTEAWAAYSREKDDETSNLDDMNVSNLLDGTQLPPIFLLPYLSIFL